MPADPAARYEALQWLMFQMGGIGPMFGQLGFFHKFAGKDYEDKRPRDRYVAESRRLLGVLDRHLAGRDWIMGDDYTVADIATWPWVNNLVGFYGAGELVGYDRLRQVQRRASSPAISARQGSTRSISCAPACMISPVSRSARSMSLLPSGKLATAATATPGGAWARARRTNRGHTHRAATRPGAAAARSARRRMSASLSPSLRLVRSRQASAMRALSSTVRTTQTSRSAIIASSNGTAVAEAACATPSVLA
jgi:hypothetical protein